MAEGEAQPEAATTYSNIRGYCKKSADVIVSRQRATTESNGNVEVSHKDKGRNVRRKGLSEKLSMTKRKESTNA